MSEHTQACPACSGRGRFTEWTGDSEDDYRAPHTCENCDGSGYLADCRICLEVISLPEAELNGYACGQCCADLEMSDARAEYRHVGRCA